MSDQHPGLKQIPAFETVLVGTGFDGMYMLHRLRGMGLRVRLRDCWRRRRYLVLESLARRAAMWEACSIPTSTRAWPRSARPH